MAKTRYFFLSFFLFAGSAFADTNPAEGLRGILLDPVTGKPICQLGPETPDSDCEQCREEHFLTTSFKEPFREPIQMAAVPLAALAWLSVIGLSAIGCNLGVHQAATENENARLAEIWAEAEGRRGEGENSPQERHPKKWFHFAHGAQFISSLFIGVQGFNLAVRSAAKTALGTFGFFSLGTGMAVSGITASCYMLQKRTYEGQDSP